MYKTIIEHPPRWDHPLHPPLQTEKDLLFTNYSFISIGIIVIKFNTDMVTVVNPLITVTIATLFYKDMNFTLVQPG